jgi:hypothetical protein
MLTFGSSLAGSALLEVRAFLASGHEAGMPTNQSHWLRSIDMRPAFNDGTQQSLFDPVLPSASATTRSGDGNDGGSTDEYSEEEWC